MSLHYKEYSSYSNSYKYYSFGGGDLEISSIKRGFNIEVEAPALSPFLRLSFFERWSLWNYASERVRKDARRIIKEGL